MCPKELNWIRKSAPLPVWAAPSHVLGPGLKEHEPSISIISLYFWTLDVMWTAAARSPPTKQAILSNHETKQTPPSLVAFYLVFHHSSEKSNETMAWHQQTQLHYNLSTRIWMKSITNDFMFQITANMRKLTVVPRGHRIPLWTSCEPVESPTLTSPCIEDLHRRRLLNTGNGLMGPEN